MRRQVLGILLGFFLLGGFVFIGCKNKVHSADSTTFVTSATPSVETIVSMTSTAVQLTPTPETQATLIPTTKTPLYLNSDGNAVGLNTPLPLVDMISTDNILQMKELAVWGEGRVLDAKYTPDGEQIVVATSQGFERYDAQDFHLIGKVLIEIPVSDRREKFLLSPCTQYFAYSNLENDRVIVIDTLSGNEVFNLVTKKGYLFVFSPDSLLFISDPVENNTVIYDLSKKQYRDEQLPAFYTITFGDNSQDFILRTTTEVNSLQVYEEFQLMETIDEFDLLDNYGNISGIYEDIPFSQYFFMPGGETMVFGHTSLGFYDIEEQVIPKMLCLEQGIINTGDAVDTNEHWGICNKVDQKCWYDVDRACYSFIDQWVISPDGRGLSIIVRKDLVFSSSTGYRELQYYDLETGRYFRSMPYIEKIYAYTPDGDNLLVSSGGILQVINVRDGGILFSLQDHFQSSDLQFQTGQDTLAAGIFPRTLSFLNVTSMQEGKRLELDGDITALSFFPDGQSLALGTQLGYGKVQIVDVESATVSPIDNRNFYAGNNVSKIEISSDNNRIYANMLGVEGENYFKVYQMDEAQIIFDTPIGWIDFDITDEFLIFAEDYDGIALYNVDNFQIIKNYSTEYGGQIQIDDTGRLLASKGHGGLISIISVDGEEIYQFDLEEDPNYPASHSLLFYENMFFVVHNNQVVVYDLDQGLELLRMEFESTMKHIDISSDGRYVAVSGEDGIIHIWGVPLEGE